MKKGILLCTIAVAIVLVFGTASAYASFTGGQGACYVDADGDGVCDNYGSGAGCTQSGGCGGQGACYVDADGDGVCDNCGSGAGCAQSGGCGGRPQDGTGMKWGHCGGRGHR